MDTSDCQGAVHSTTTGFLSLHPRFNGTRRLPAFLLCIRTYGSFCFIVVLILVNQYNTHINNPNDTTSELIHSSTRFFFGPPINHSLSLRPSFIRLLFTHTASSSPPPRTSYDSRIGMRWLSSMTNSNETNTVDMTDWLRKGLLQSATTYAQLRSAWLTQNSKSSLSHLLEMYLSLGMVEESVDTANFPTTANTSSSIYWADLSASLIWPRLVTSRKQPVRRSVAQCLIRTSVPANTPASVSSQTEADEATLEQALRAYFPPTIPGESVQCDLIVTNPSDRPVFIQPILLDAVYAMRCNTTESCENQTTGESSRATEPLVSFLHALGVPASTEHAIKLNHLLTGTFHVELVNGSPFTGSLDAQLSSPPCCPIMWLPASAGQLVLRLTFTPDFSSSPRSSVGGKVIQQTSHNLLLLRNNLTALEPIWLNAQLGKAEISLGTVDTEENAPPSDTGTKKEAKSNIATSTGTKSRTKPISQTATLNLIVRGEWHASALPGNDNNSDPVSIGTTNGSDLLPTGLWVSSVIPPLMLPATLTPFIRMDFDFTERTFWPLCTRDSDPQLAYTIHKRLHSDLPMHEKPTAGAELPLVNSITDSGELLASLSFRRRLALINSGDVPVELRAILLVPGSRILTPNVSNDWVSDPRSGSSAFHVTCSYRGFRVSPCLTYKVQKPRDPSSAVSDETQWENKNHSILLAPRERFLIELQYRPDFVYSSTTARLWILAHPHHSGSVDMPMERLLAECMGHPTEMPALGKTNELSKLVVLFLFTINLLGVMVMGCLDANRLYTAHKRVRSRLNRVPYNAQPDPIRVLRFDPLVADPFGSGSDDGTSVAQIIGDGTGTKMKSVVDRSGTVKKEPSLGLTDFEPGHLTTLSPSGILTGSSRMTSKSRSSAPSDTITVATPITTSAVKSAVGRPVVNDVRTDSGTRDEVLFSASDDEPWILSRSSFKLLSKTPLMITSSPLLKHPLEDRKMTKSARKSDALKVTSAEVVGSVPDRPGGRAKKKLSQRSGEMDEHGYPSSSEPSQLTSALSAVDDDHELVSTKLSPIRRTTRKPTTINPNSGIRSKVSDAPKTEAGIAAAVRATMRLAEETGSQARRRSTLHVPDRLRVTRDKRELLSGHSSTSSSSGPDQDPVLNKSKSHRTNMTPFTGSQREKPSPARHPVQVEQQRPQREQGHRLQQQNQTLSLPTHSFMNRSSPVNVPKRFSDYSTTDRPHEPMLEEHHPHAYLYDCFDHEDRPRAHSDFQISVLLVELNISSIGIVTAKIVRKLIDIIYFDVLHRRARTRLGDWQNEFVPDVLTPHLGLCWPASTVEYERSHSYHNALICGLWPDGFGPPPPPGPHWDDAVVEITTMNGLDPVPTLKRSRAWSAQEAMDQIAADSRAFSEFLTRLSPRTTTQRDSPSDQQAETDSNLVLAQVNGSDQTDHCDLEQPVTQGPVGTKSDRKQSWDSAFAPLHPPPGTNSLLCHPPASGLSDHEPAVVPSSDRSNSSPLSSPSSLKWADNSAVNANMDHARQVLEPLMQDFLLSPSSEVDGSTSMNRWKSLDETYQACSQPVSSSFSHYFYELPQITMARRMCMLKHERRLDETRWLNSSSSLVTDDATDKVDHIASTADETQVTNTSEELDESAPHESSGKSESQFSRTLRKCKRRKSESYAHTESVVDTSEAGGLQRPSNLSELIKSTQHALHLSSGSPLFSSSMCQLATSTTTSTSTPTNKTATSVTATPPECAHSQSGRRMSDTLDDTDNVLAFGPDFSYRSSTQLTPTDWSTDLTPTGSDAPTVSDMLRTVLRAEESYRFGLDLILSSQWNSEHMSTETNNAG
ncbi:hypothetical protein D915_001106 [Fasciola hepatica]|uniref:Transmembrane protein n=1 Tax=Fasciola hepatica TaxID=6192 RepID=A0A4E0RXD9_FASHE|nr:hypothetical protein D915_001106 [Fasciola hepatica]